MVKFEIITANSDTIKNNLDKGIVDLGLLVEPVDITKYNFKKMAQKEQWGILTKSDSSLAKKSLIKPQDLINERLLNPYLHSEPVNSIIDVR